MKSRHLDHFPYSSEMNPRALEAYAGVCGPKAVLGTLRYFRKRGGVDRVVRQCRMRRRAGGTILAALASALKRNGLSVALYTLPFTTLSSRHRRIYEEAIRLKVPIRPALTLPEVMSRVDAEHVAIVGHVLMRFGRTEDFHISPLVGMYGRQVGLPYAVQCYTYTKREFDWVWRAPSLHRQCLIATDLPEREGGPYRVPKWLQRAIVRSKAEEPSQARRRKM